MQNTGTITRAGGSLQSELVWRVRRELSPVGFFWRGLFHSYSDCIAYYDVVNCEFSAFFAGPTHNYVILD